MKAGGMRVVVVFFHAICEGLLDPAVDIRG